MTTDCSAVAQELQRCAAEANAVVSCIVASGPVGDGTNDLRLRDPRTLFVRFPELHDTSLGLTGTLTLTGPARIAVSARGNPLPCTLGVSGCAGAGIGALGCIDTLFSRDGSCGTVPDDDFPQFTALPIRNDYSAICTDPTPQCTGSAQDLRMAVDGDGNLLLPMDWSGVQVAGQDGDVARIVRGATSIEAFPGTDISLRVPDLGFLVSFSTNGHRLSPIFDPLRTGTVEDVTQLLGSVDAPQTVLRIARHAVPLNQCVDGDPTRALPCVGPQDCPLGQGCGEQLCQGGTRAETNCASDADCPGGECGAGLFDFASRRIGGVGPVLLRRGTCLGGQNALAACTSDASCAGGRCTDFTAVALDPVPLDGLSETPSLFNFVKLESIAGRDLNQDGDQRDQVIELLDKASGEAQPIGRSAGIGGRAVAQVVERRFTFPAVAAVDDLIAFLEPEGLEGRQDRTGNGEIFDTVLRVFRSGSGGATELTRTLGALAADGAPVLNGRPLVISDGLVLFRTSEAAVAPTLTERASLSSSGAQAVIPGGDEFLAEDLSEAPSLSADGQIVAFASSAKNLASGNGATETLNFFVRDRAARRTSLVVPPTEFVERSDEVASGFSGTLTSADGRFLLLQFEVDGEDGIFVNDRDTRQSRMIFKGADLGRPAISADFSWVSIGGGDYDGPLLSSTAPGGRFYLDDGETPAIDVPFRGNFFHPAGALSSDGRYLAFATNQLLPGDGPIVLPGSIVVEDRDPDRNGVFDEPGRTSTVRVSVSSNGDPAIDAFVGYDRVAISGDGRFVAFASDATNLVPGDTAGTDVFVHDRDADEDGVFDELDGIRTDRASVSSDGRQLDGGEACCATMSSDGRYVAFQSDAEIEDGAPPLGCIRFGEAPQRCSSVYVHDRVTRLTVRASAALDGGFLDGDAERPAFDASGRHLAYQSRATNIVSGDTNGAQDVFVRAPSKTGDITGNGRSTDTILRLFDTSTNSVRNLCPASTAAVSGRTIAFLRPEGAGGGAGCPSGSDLNGDGDLNDDVVHLALNSGATILNLRRGATAVALSSSWIAAVIPENGDGRRDRNGDGDVKDRTLAVRPAQSSGTWTEVRQAADVAAVAGTLVAFLTPEEAQDGRDLNGDGDADDRVLQLYEAATSTVTNLGQAAEDLVLGDTLLAFRTRESAQGEDLNADGDLADDVLQVYDRRDGRLFNSGMAVVPCSKKACDPSKPYRVQTDTVRFEVLERDQGRRDLNDDNLLGEVQVVFNVQAARLAESDDAADMRLAAAVQPAASVSVLGGIASGVCTDTGQACDDDDQCPVGTCYLPPGGCVRPLGTPCCLTDVCKADGTVGCEPGDVCRPLTTCAEDEPGCGECVRPENACRTGADCQPGAECTNAEREVQRLASPLVAPAAGGVVFTSAGRCLETFQRTCGPNRNCPPGATCTAEARCEQDHGTCRSDDDCPPDVPCRRDLVVATAADRDADELPDPVDNCPDVANVDQQDRDRDGIGDACDAVECSDLLTDRGGRLPLVDADGDGRCEPPTGTRVLKGTLVVGSRTPLEVRGTTRIEADAIILEAGGSIMGRDDQLTALALVARKGSLRLEGTLDLAPSDDLTLLATGGPIEVLGQTRVVAGDRVTMKAVRGGIALMPREMQGGGDLAIRAATRIDLQARVPGTGLLLEHARLGSPQIVVDTRTTSSANPAPSPILLRGGSVLTTDRGRTGFKTGNDVVLSATGTVRISDAAQLDAGRQVTIVTTRAEDHVCLETGGLVEARTVAGKAGRIVLSGVRGAVYLDPTAQFTGLVSGKGPIPGACP